MNDEQELAEFEAWLYLDQTKYDPERMSKQEIEIAKLAYQAGRAVLQSQVKNDRTLFCDLKTDEEKSAFFLSGRGYETGVIAQAIQNDVAMAYYRCAEYKKELDALQAQPVIDDDHLSTVLDVYDNAMQKAFDGREFQNPCKPGTPEHKAWEKGSKEGKKKRDAGLPHSIALQSQNDISKLVKRLREADKPLMQQNTFSEVRALLREAADALQAQDREDAERLDWLAGQEAQLQSLTLANGTRYRLVWPDDGDCQSEWFKTVREAIDHARRVEGE